MSKPVVFISYSHKDEDWKDRLLAHLGVLQQQEYLELWDDRRIGAGEDWEAAILTAMKKASVAILLVSANSLTSHFILRKEVTRLLKRRDQEGLRIFPIIIKPCDWMAVDWLKEMNLRPKDGKAISGGNEHQVDQDLAKIAEEIRLFFESPPSRIAPVSIAEPPHIYQGKAVKKNLQRPKISSLEDCRDIAGITLSLIINSRMNSIILLSLFCFSVLGSAFLPKLSLVARFAPFLSAIPFYLTTGYFQWRQSNSHVLAKYVGHSAEFFRYLRPFDEKSKDAFFGRENKIVSAANLLLASDYRAGILVGESGSGKTSLVKAGIVPCLSEAETIPVMYVSLENTPEVDIQEILSEHRLRQPEASRQCTLLILDQIEVWVKQDKAKDRAPSEIKRDIQREVEAGRIKLLLVVRKEFYIDLLYSFEPLLPEISHPNNRIDLNKFDKHTAERVLECVAEQNDLQLEPALVEAMLADLDSGGVLPAELQIVCSVLHEKYQACRLENYRELGGKDGIIKRFLEERVLMRFPDHLVSSVKSILLALIQENEGRALEMESIQRETQGLFILGNQIPIAVNARAGCAA